VLGDDPPRSALPPRSRLLELLHHPHRLGVGEGEDYATRLELRGDRVERRPWVGHGGVAAGAAGGHVPQVVLQPRQGVVDRGPQQVALRGDVVEERGATHPRPPGDVGHRRRRVTLLEEELTGGFLQHRAGCGPRPSHTSRLTHTGDRTSIVGRGLTIRGTVHPMVEPRLIPLPRRRGARLATAAVALSLTLAACSSGDGEDAATGEPVEGGTLVYATGDAEPTCLDPHVGGNYPQALVSTQFLEPLVGRDADGQIQPWLATDWQVSEDGLTWDLTLAAGVTFTDGAPVAGVTACAAEAVKGNIEHLQGPAAASSTGWLAVQKSAEVEAVDDTHVRFHLSEPDSALLESLSMQWTAIQSPAGIARGMEENCAAPIGTGPFVVTEWVPQQHVLLERNEDYATPGPQAQNDGPSYIERIEWRFIPDPATRWAALQSGEVHVIDNPEPEAIVAAEAGDEVTHIDAPRPGSVNRIELNSAQPPFDDIRVRQA